MKTEDVVTLALIVGTAYFTGKSVKNVVKGMRQAVGTGGKDERYDYTPIYYRRGG